MKKIEKYVCDWCESEYSDSKDVEQHELSCSERPERLHVDVSALTKFDCRAVFRWKDEGVFKYPKQWQSARCVDLPDQYSSQEVYCAFVNPITSQTRGKLW